MKLFSSAAALCALACAAGPALALDYPPRKPGLWEMSMTDADTKSPPTTMQQCIDAASDKAMREMGQGVSQGLCSKNELRSEGGKLIADSVCKIGNSTATSHGVITGDFGSSYRMETRSTYDPPVMGKKEGTAIVETRWIGPCKAGQRPGDVMMGNGMKMNVLDAMAGKPRK